MHEVSRQLVSFYGFSWYNTYRKRLVIRMKKIWLIRHGESIANAGEPTQDHAAIPLSEKGLQQAQELALAIPSAPDLIVTSPFCGPSRRRCRRSGGFLRLIRGFGTAFMNLCIWRRRPASARPLPSGVPGSSPIGGSWIPTMSTAKAPKATGSLWSGFRRR